MGDIVQYLSEIFKALPPIIIAAASSRLGFAALMVILLAVLAYTFFVSKESSEWTRVGIFVLLLAGVAAFVSSIGMNVDSCEVWKARRPAWTVACNRVTQNAFYWEVTTYRLNDYGNNEVDWRGRREPECGNASTGTQGATWAWPPSHRTWNQVVNTDLSPIGEPKRLDHPGCQKDQQHCGVYRAICRAIPMCQP